MSSFLLTVTLLTAQLPSLPASQDAAAVRANDDVAQAAREFRRLVYSQLRTHREEFDRRWSAGEELWRHWEALSRPAAHRDQILAWFVTATEATATGAPLPVLPNLPEPTLPTTFENIPAPAINASSLPAPSLAPPQVNAKPSSLEEDNPFLPAPGADNTPKDASGPGLPGQIRSLLNFGESAFGGAETP